MKTTLNIRDGLYRKAKARAALRGMSLGRFLEESLERMLRNSPDEEVSWSDWAAALPEISKKAAQDLINALDSPGFRLVEPEMWE